jgi:hypothetical protein
VKRTLSDSGVTLIEALIGLFIFMCILVPLVRFAGSSTESARIKDLKIATAVLRGECAVMYKNQKMPAAQRFITIDKSIYEISFASVHDSILADWSMSVAKAGRSLADVHGLLYVGSK